MDTFLNVNGTWVKCESLDDFRHVHYARISREYNKFIETGRATVTVNGETFGMQIRDSDIARMDGAIRYNEIGGVTEMYVTDADNVTHYHVSIADAKAILAEMMRVAYGAHAAKQMARAQIDAALTVEEMEAVKFGDL
jgi:hypothetical protein